MHKVARKCRKFSPEFRDEAVRLNFSSLVERGLGALRRGVTGMSEAPGRRAID
jgi:transposase-like protein